MPCRSVRIVCKEERIVFADVRGRSSQERDPARKRTRRAGCTCDRSDVQRAAAGRSGPQFAAGILAQLHDGALCIEHREDRFVLAWNDLPIGFTRFRAGAHPNLAVQQSAELLDASERVALRHDRPVDVPLEAEAASNGSNGSATVLHGDALHYHLYSAENRPRA